MDGDKVNGAVGTNPQELAHPNVAIVGDRGRAKLGLSSKGLHVAEICIRGCSGVDIGLACVLRLVEGQEV